MGGCAGRCTAVKSNLSLPLPRNGKASKSKKPDSEVAPLMMNTDKPAAKRVADTGASRGKETSQFDTPKSGVSGSISLTQLTSFRTCRDASAHDTTRAPCCASAFRCFADFFTNQLGFFADGDDDPALRPSSGVEEKRMIRKVSTFRRQLSSFRASGSSNRNPNKVSHFAWLSPLLQDILQKKGASSSIFTPLFVVAGACPNKLAPMQAMLYSATSDSAVEFWWVKPQKGNNQKLEENTLKLNDKGPHKNAPASSKAVYAPLAEQFCTVVAGRNFQFRVEGGKAILEETTPSQGCTTMQVYLIWQEEWSGLLSWGKKYMRGKICYKRENKLYARQYRIDGSDVVLAPREQEEELQTTLPPDTFQELRPDDSWARTTRTTRSSSRRNLPRR